MRVGSLCSGYGGLDLAVTAVLGGRVAWHAEKDKAASRVLAHHWPGTPNLGDITAADWSTVEPVDVLQQAAYALNLLGVPDLCGAP